MSTTSRATSCAAHVRYRNGCPACRDAKRAYEANRIHMIASGEWEGLADGTGARRRIQALVYGGWPLTWLSARLGGDSTLARKILARRCGLTAATDRAVRALYDDLWDQEPPAVTTWDRRAVAAARKHAREHGWVPALAWDEDPGPHFIDDPAAVPVPGCVRGERREWGAVAADAAELDAQGEIPEMIAQRLGVTVKTVERTLQRALSAERRAA